VGWCRLMRVQNSDNSNTPPVVNLVDAARLSEAILAMLDTRLNALEQALSDMVNSTPGEGAGELEPLLTTRDVARLLGCDQRSVHRWLRDGVVPEPIRIGGVLRWYAPGIREWIMSKQGTLKLEGGSANEGA